MQLYKVLADLPVNPPQPARHRRRPELETQPEPDHHDPKSSRRQGVSEVTLRVRLALDPTGDEQSCREGRRYRQRKPPKQKRNRRNLAVCECQPSEPLLRCFGRVRRRSTFTHLDLSLDESGSAKSSGPSLLSNHKYPERIHSTQGGSRNNRHQTGSTPRIRRVMWPTACQPTPNASTNS